ncbi:hypothetical protein [Chitinophaga sp. CF418]|uniref:hypothetical protein n=1 Tax=Chitinophaga sp. CF418 TaxID=1855287 RepID=UPI00091CAACB|nr:hypothetical protein [Chitinophaga sp. CF418]SHN36934.1 hypothetical protein SAMN05216311_110153 [Chitinophaga sp. CF418]
MQKINSPSTQSHIPAAFPEKFSTNNGLAHEAVAPSQLKESKIPVQAESTAPVQTDRSSIPPFRLAREGVVQRSTEKVEMKGLGKGDDDDDKKKLPLSTQGQPTKSRRKRTKKKENTATQTTTPTPAQTPKNTATPTTTVPDQPKTDLLTREEIAKELTTEITDLAGFVNEKLQVQATRIPFLIDLVKKVSIPSRLFLFDSSGKIYIEEEENNIRRTPALLPYTKKIKIWEDLQIKLIDLNAEFSEKFEILQSNLINAVDYKEAVQLLSALRSASTTIIEPALDQSKKDISNARKASDTSTKKILFTEREKKLRGKEDARFSIEELQQQIEELVPFIELVEEARRALPQLYASYEKCAREYDILNAQVVTIRKEYDIAVKKLEEQNQMLAQQMQNQQQLEAISATADQDLADYHDFGGEIEDNSNTFSDYKLLHDEVKSLYELLKNEDIEFIQAHIFSHTKQTAVLASRFPELKKPLPEAKALSSWIDKKKKDIEEELKEYRDIKSLRQQTSEAKEDDQLPNLIEEKKQIKSRYNNAIGKAVNLVIIDLKAIRNDERALDEQLFPYLEGSEALRSKLTSLRISTLSKKNADYSRLIESLLNHPRVIDKFNLNKELSYPVAEEKYESRCMELQYLVDALSGGAFVQVGRMRKDSLVEALKGIGFLGQAAAVNEGNAQTYEADGIIWFSDTKMEVVQHKMTVTRNLFGQRKHSVGEITGPQFEKQLSEAANQLCGLTAQGNAVNSLHASGEPEIPPPGIGRERIANLKFTNVKVPVSTQTFEEVIEETMDVTVANIKRYRCVEKIVLNFADGKIIYKRIDNTPVYQKE